MIPERVGTRCFTSATKRASEENGTSVSSVVIWSRASVVCSMLFSVCEFFVRAVVRLPAFLLVCQEPPFSLSLSLAMHYPSVCWGTRLRVTVLPIPLRYTLKKSRKITRNLCTPVGKGIFCAIGIVCLCFRNTHSRKKGGGGVGRAVSPGYHHRLG